MPPELAHLGKHVVSKVLVFCNLLIKSNLTEKFKTGMHALELQSSYLIQALLLNWKKRCNPNFLHLPQNLQ